MGDFFKSFISFNIFLPRYKEFSISKASNVSNLKPLLITLSGFNESIDKPWLFSKQWFANVEVHLKSKSDILELLNVFRLEECSENRFLN